MISYTFLLRERNGSGLDSTRGKLHLLEQLIFPSKLHKPKAAHSELQTSVPTALALIQSALLPAGGA